MNNNQQTTYILRWVILVLTLLILLIGLFGGQIHRVLTGNPASPSTGPGGGGSLGPPVRIVSVMPDVNYGALMPRITL